jgi:long-chain acyl-CoA synthetase
MRTIPILFEEAVKKYSKNPLLKEKITNEYQSISYEETRDKVYHFAAGLMSLGVMHGDRIALISEGRNDWIISELAILYCGAINVPLSVKLIESTEIKFRINHAECKIIITSKGQAAKIKEIKQDCPSLEKIIFLDEQDVYEKNELFKDEVYNLGTKFLSENGSLFEARWTSLKNEDAANICYTSGTTADPKGIILSHRNYTANVEQACTLMTIPEDYCTLFILPLDHSFAHCVFYCFIYKGASIASIQIGKTPMETLKNIPINMKEIKPNLILSVPALAKNFRKNIEKGINDKGKLASSLLKIALKTAYVYNGNGYNKGKAYRILFKPFVNLFNSILFSKVRDGFGGQLDFFIGGGALLDTELQKFFYAIGIPMMQGYGLSEASPVISSNALHKHKLGSSGCLVQPLELRIEDEKGNALPPFSKGEIAIKGENVMLGYWKNDIATQETIKEGWLHTGDLGYVDNDGFLYVMGRYKSLLIANDGEKYSPEGIEEQLTEHISFVDQVMLYNNQNNYTTGIIVLNKEAVRKWSKHHDHNQQINEDEKAKHFLKQLHKEIMHQDKVGNNHLKFPERWLPSTFLVLDEAFTEQNQMLNSTLKMVRGKITEKYKSQIDYLYTPEGKDVTNVFNLGVIKRIIS